MSSGALRRISLHGLLLAAVLAACGPEATPFPVDIPTPSAAVTSVPAAAPDTAPDETVETGELRYALAPNTTDFVTDLPLLEQSARLIMLDAPVNPADAGSRYDLIAAYGDLPGGQRSPVGHQIALLINPRLPPLDDSAVVAVLRHTINPQAVLTALDIPGAAAEPLESAPTKTLREELANAGWPDGFDLELLPNAPGAAPVAAALGTAGITVHVRDAADTAAAFEAGTAHLALVAWTAPEVQTEWETRVGAANVLPLYSLPVSYLAAPGLNITFTPDGWPLPAR